MCVCVRVYLCMSVCACINERERGYPVSLNFNPFGTCSATITIIIEHNTSSPLDPFRQNGR